MKKIHVNFIPITRSMKQQNYQGRARVTHLLIKKFLEKFSSTHAREVRIVVADVKAQTLGSRWVPAFPCDCL